MFVKASCAVAVVLVGSAAAATLSAQQAAGGRGASAEAAERSRPAGIVTVPAALSDAQKLEAALDRRIDIAFSDTPLRDVVDFLSQETGVTFHIATRRLEEAGVRADTPVTSRFQQIRLRTWLSLVLGEMDLAYVEKDDLIVITTPEEEERSLVVRVYDCRDLLSMPEPPWEARQRKAAARATEGQLEESEGMAGRYGYHGTPPWMIGHAGRLIDVITNGIDMDSWDDLGGPGTISEYNGLIVITQTPRTHKKVERVLDMLRQAAGLEKPAGGGVVR